MKIEKETGVIGLLIGVLLVPMWFFALASHESESAVVLSEDRGVINPTETFLPMPVEVNEFVAGVVTFVALFALMGMLYYTLRYIRVISHLRRSRAEHRDGTVAPDGGQTRDAPSLPPYLLSGSRRLAEYWPADYATPGMIGIVVMSWTATSFSLLFGVEAFTWARTQYLGVYAGMAFISLGVFATIYTASFMPRIHVAEDRGHEGKLTKRSDSDNQ